MGSSEIRDAAELARIVMGKASGRSGPGIKWAADEDPLAWWYLVELLLSFKHGHWHAVASAQIREETQK